MVTKFVRVKFEQPGFHYWKDAPEGYYYLNAIHRHLFKVSVIVKLPDEKDRSIEFHELKAIAHNHFLNIVEWNPESDNHEKLQKSCETMAIQLIDKLRKDFPNVDTMSVEVSEDGECSGIVNWQRS